MNFEDNIDYDVLTAKGVSIGETLKLINDSFSAYIFVMGFDSNGTPIVEYNQVKYHEDIDWENSKYGHGDAFEDGDVLPYVYSNFGELPNMGLIHPSEIENLPPINVNKVEPPKGLYDTIYHELSEM